MRIEYRDDNGENPAYYFDDVMHGRCELSGSCEPEIWFGIAGNADRQMNLNQEQVKALLPLLTHFAEHGELPREGEGEK